jgi:hypothetical protein
LSTFLGPYQLLQLFERDPVRTTQLTFFVSTRYEEAKAVCGGEEAFKRIYLMAFTEVETKKADKGHRPLPANLAVLDELEAYLRPTQDGSGHR